MMLEDIKRRAEKLTSWGAVAGMIAISIITPTPIDQMLMIGVGGVCFWQARKSR